MKEYSVREATPPDVKTELAEYPEFLQQLLFNRGIVSSVTARDFLFPDYGKIFDPNLLFDMEKAVDRILQAIVKNEKVLIYSDYDADGIPGAVVLHDFFKKIAKYDNFENYIPHRHDEGYGLHLEAVEDFAKRGVKLIITVDCGIADEKEIRRAEELGIDVIITDHHEFPEKIPKATAVVNPKRADCLYPYKMLCGAGVAFKLVQAILKKKDFGQKPGMEKWLLDMVGLATLSDMVPLDGENRIFAHYGLKVLRKSPRPGIMKLLSELKISQRDLTEDDVQFMITPRINAASRMGAPDDAFTLLSSSDAVLAGSAVTRLNKTNDERKGVVAGMVKEIRKKVGDDQGRKVIVAGNPEWRPSLLGLAANSLAEDFNCPVFLWGRDGGSMLKGSCRSDGLTDMMALMRSAGKSFLEFGGHRFAGGFSVSHERVHLLEEDLLRAFGQKTETGILAEKNWIDKKISLDQVNWSTYGSIEKMAPFGLGNPKPLFIFEEIPIFDVKYFGKEKNHLELSFLSSGGKQIKAIAFFFSKELMKAKPEKGKKINLISSIEKSVFRGFPELRLRISDIISL